MTLTLRNILSHSNPMIQDEKKKHFGDAALIAVLFLCNPVIWNIDRRVAILFPDSIAYIKMADEILRSGILYLRGWGHVDSVLILPPVYPILIAIGKLYIKGGIITAEFVSSACIIFSTIPLYFYISRTSSKSCAFVALLLIQLNYYFLSFGTSVLSEATFILSLSIGLFAIERYVSSNFKISYSFFLGTASSLIVLTRHVGISFILTLMLYISLLYLSSTKIIQQQILKSTTYFIVGFLFIITPYSILLYNQTGKSFLTNQYRLGKYSVTAPNEILSQIETIDLKDYNKRYKQRRELRKLTPDSSEMLGHATNFTKKDSHSIKIATNKFLSSPSSLLYNLFRNINHIKITVGLVLTILFVISLFTFFIRMLKSTDNLHQAFVPLFLLTYILLISFISGSSIVRYINVIYPFVTITILIEINHLLRYRIFKLGPKAHFCFISFLALIFLFSTPRLSVGVKTKPKVLEHETPYYFCSQLIKQNSPIFTIHPFDSYVLGGWFRVLPNDSLEKISNYASKTGVKWLFIDSNGDKLDKKHYNHADWLKNSTLLSELYPDLVQLRCRVSNQLWLYEFKPTSNSKQTSEANSTPPFLPE